MIDVITWIREHWTMYLPIIVAIVGLARLIIIATPSQNDDSWLAKVIVWLSYIGLHIPDDKAAGIAESKHAIKAAGVARAKKALRAQKHADKG